MNIVKRIREFDTTYLMVIDAQEGLMNVVYDSNRTLSNISRLIRASNLFNIKVIYTEQAPNKLGKTVSEISQIIQTSAVSKSTFSAFDETIKKELNDSKADNIIICGVESHVCVLQTALDLIENGYDVYVIVDATSSRFEIDKEYALERLKVIECSLSTTESFIFEICRTANRPEFKEISAIIKESNHSK